MRSYSQNQPTGTGGDADFFQKILRQLREELQFYDSESIGWRMMPRGILAYSKNTAFGGSGGIQWNQPNRELDSRVAVPKNTLVYISPDNPLVTSPATDRVLGIAVAAPSGTWLSLQDVPANSIISGIVNYNVPQLPTPGAVSGTPLSGDLDGSNVFWDRIERASLC